mmetsp:Transcript_96687/g.221535  ORF Transcript_96687/g.221535 Transcript_96687/m.221535 type:complete len:241 (+) Transcript_96687:564-1286(+)
METKRNAMEDALFSDSLRGGELELQRGCCREAFDFVAHHLVRLLPSQVFDESVSDSCQPPIFLHTSLGRLASAHDADYRQRGRIGEGKPKRVVVEGNIPNTGGCRKLQSDGLACLRLPIRQTAHLVRNNPLFGGLFPQRRSHMYRTHWHLLGIQINAIQHRGHQLPVHFHHHLPGAGQDIRSRRPGKESQQAGALLLSRAPHDIWDLRRQHHLAHRHPGLSRAGVLHVQGPQGAVLVPRH